MKLLVRPPSPPLANKDVALEREAHEHVALGGRLQVRVRERITLQPSSSGVMLSIEFSSRSSCMCVGTLPPCVDIQLLSAILSVASACSHHASPASSISKSSSTAPLPFTLMRSDIVGNEGSNPLGGALDR